MDTKAAAPNIDDILHPGERARTEIVQLDAGIRTLGQIIDLLSGSKTLADIDTGTLEVMRRTLSGRANDSSHGHEQRDQLAAIRAELCLRNALSRCSLPPIDGRRVQVSVEQQRDAEFNRKVAAVRGAL